MENKINLPLSADDRKKQELLLKAIAENYESMSAAPKYDPSLDEKAEESWESERTAHDLELDEDRISEN